MSDRPSDLPPLPAPPTDEAPMLARPLASVEPPSALPEAWLVPRSWALGVTALAAAGLLISVLLWQKLDGIQAEVARRTTDNSSQAVEARTLAREAQETTRDLAARLAQQETRLGEVGLQRAQLDELMQSLARSRDENLVVDVESELRLAQQQALLTGSVQPLLAALKAADVRLTRAVQPRLNPLQRAVTRDIERIKNANVTDVPSLMLKLDELARLVDELPVANDPVDTSSARAVPVKTDAPPLATAPAGKSSWLPGLETLRNGSSRVLASLWQEASQLLRVSRIDYPEAALLAPEQAFFLRENLKLRLLNARLALLSRQSDAARADLLNASAWLNKYFDREARKTQAAQQLLTQVQSQLKTTELPRLDDTMAALATAATAR